MLEIAWNAKKTWNFEEKKIWNFIFFNIKKIHKKFKQHSINIKNYTAHPHDLVHVPAKFRENTAMRFWVTVRKLKVTDGQTDGQTDGGRCNISRPGPPEISLKIHILSHYQKWCVLGSWVIGCPLIGVIWR